jgi:hypothetical protein
VFQFEYLRLCNFGASPWRHLGIYGNIGTAVASKGRPRMTRNLAALKTILTFIVAISAFNLGRYSIEFTGSTASWVAVICGGGALIGGCWVLIRSFWKL